MMTCPKCGFEQPEDRFCANCGVDMEKYLLRHARRPAWQRVVASYLFQSLLIITIVVCTSVLIYRKKKIDIDHLREAVENVTGVAISNSEPKQSIRAPVKPATNGSAVSDEEDLSSANEPVATETEPAKTETQAKAPVTSNPSVRFRLAEIATSFLSRISDVKPLATQGGMVGGFVPTLQNHLQPGEGSGELTYLDSADTQNAEVGKALHFSKSNPDPATGASLGIEVTLIPNSLDPKGLHCQLSIVRSSRDAQGVARPAHWRETLTLTENSGVFVYGLWPHRAPLPGEDRLLPDLLLQLMSKMEFLNSLTELVLLVDGSGLPEASNAGS